MNGHGGCKGQLALELQAYRDTNQHGGTIQYPRKTTVSLLYDEKDYARVERFRRSFPEIDYRVFDLDGEDSDSEERVDYILIFFSVESAKNIEFLETFLNINENKTNKKVCGFIINDKLRDESERFELYKYYKRRVKEIWELRNEFGSNEDFRRCLDVYERSYERISEYIVKLLEADANKKICAEDKFETYLKRDDRRISRVRVQEEKRNKNEEVKCMESNSKNNVYNLIASENSQIILTQGDKNSLSVQNNDNGSEKDEFALIYEAIQKASNELETNNKETVQNILEEIRKEYEDSRKQKKAEESGKRYRKCMSWIGQMLTIANGIPVLAENLGKLQTFLTSNMP